MTDQIDTILAGLDRYIAALNAEDSAAMRAEFHFPHYRLSGAGVQVYEEPEDYGIEIFHARADTDDWGHTEWNERRVIQAGANKVHFDVQFTRYKKDGSVLGVYKSLWIVTKIDGKWGVQARSSYAE